MGCVQGKGTTTNSPNRSLDKLKIESDYIKVENAGRGTRASRRRRGAKAAVEDGGGRRISRESEKGNHGGGNVPRRILGEKISADELVDGWPQWLIDNIPLDALAGLFPKSADSYDKLAKVGD